MITLLLDKPFLDADGAIMLDRQHALLSTVLAGSTTGDPLKFWDWAVALKQTCKIEIDESDCETLMTFIRGHQSLTALSRAQLLRSVMAARNGK